MNKERRKELREVADKLAECFDALDAIKAEEDEYRDNMPECLQASERYDISAQASDDMESAMSAIDEAVSLIEDAIGG